MTPRTTLLCSILFLASSAWSADSQPVHPRLLFAAQDIPGLRSKLDSPAGKLIFGHLKEFADTAARREKIPTWDTIVTYDNWETNDKDPAHKRPAPNFLEFTGQRLWAFTTAFVLTGDAKYRDLARQYLLALAEWPDFYDCKRGLDLDFAHVVGGYAYCYDCLYGELSDGERAKCREKLRQQVELQYKEVGRNENDRPWWAWTVIQNHAWWHAGAQLLASMALEGETPETEKWMKEGLDYARLMSEGTKGMDGSWPEGCTYQTFGLEAFGPAMFSLIKQKDTNFWKDNLYFKGYPAWQTYAYTPSRPDYFLMNYGDISHGGCETLAAVGPLYLAARIYNDPHAAWQAEEFLKQAKSRENWCMPDVMTLALVCLDPEMKPVGPETLPLDHRFPDLEGVIFRSSWDKDAMVFGLKCGPYGGRWNFDHLCNHELPYNPEQRAARGERVTFSEYSMGHSHEDAGTFWINWDGVDLTRKVSAYSAKAARLNNVVLVNDAGQFASRDMDAGSEIFVKSGASTPVMLSGKDFSFCVANPMPRYIDSKTGQNPLNDYTRHVLYVRRGNPGYFVMVDKLNAKEPSKFTWLANFIDGAGREGAWIKGKASDSVRVKEAGGYVNSNAKKHLLLGVNVVAPSDFTFETGEYKTSKVENHPDGDLWERSPGSLPVPSYVHVSNAEKKNELRIITLLWPCNEDDWQKKPVATVVQEDASQLQLRVQVGDRTDEIQMTYGLAGSVTLK